MIKRMDTDLKKYLTFENIILNLIIAFVYVLAGKFGLSLAFANPSATPLWPPTGIALAALLFFGYRAVPAIFLGAFIVNHLTAGTIFTSFFIALGNTGEAIVGTYLVKRFVNGVRAFENPSDIFKFAFYAACFSTMVSATVGVTTLILSGLATWNDFIHVWITWWLGDMGGNLVVAPLLIVWASKSLVKLNYKQTAHLMVAFSTLCVVSILVFSGIFPHSYIIIPIGVWIAFYFGQKGATVATICLAAIAIFFTLHGLGPYSDALSLNTSLILVQMFLAIFSVTALVFAATTFSMKRGEKILKSHEERFRALIENSFDGVVLIDATSKILYASPSIKRITGFSQEELIGTRGFDLVIPEDRSRTMRILAELVLKPGGVTHTQYRSMRKDKKIIWIRATGMNLLFEEDVNAVVVNFQDITESKLAHEKILQEKKESEAMLKSIGEGIIATDGIGKITLINNAACDILGWSENDLIGTMVVDAIPMQNEKGRVLSHEERPMTKVLSIGKEIVSSTNYYVGKDERIIPIRFTLTPIILKKDIVGTIEVFYDITKEKEIDKAKNEFVSLASHQLRTPLATINWYVEKIAENEQLNVKEKDYLDEVYQASHRMVELINALLNASRLELGTIVVEPRELDLIQTTEQVLHDFLPIIDKKKMVVVKKYQEDMPIFSADPKLLTIIIQNLLSNAIKYSEIGGEVVVTLEFKEERYFISIKDHGMGVPSHQQKKIFTKMFRADNARISDPDGTGLGLYIVNAIAKDTGGEVTFVSEENKGSTFFVSFPHSGMKKKEGQKQMR